MPDYTVFEKRLEDITGPNIRHHVVGHVHGFAFHRLLLGEAATSKSNILLTAGVHGDEPAGVEAVLQFLERDLTEILERFHIVVMPCINPSGYAHDTRENINGEDINRAFIEEVTESVLVKEQLAGRRFTFHLDMHEDYDAVGSYFYEGKEDRNWLAPAIAQEAKKIGPLDDDVGESDIPISEGVLEVDPAWGGRGFSSYVLENHADHVMITETSSNWPLNMRANVHLLTFDSVLKHYAG